MTSSSEAIVEVEAVADRQQAGQSVEMVRAPEHLLSYSWLELEKVQALRVLQDLEKMTATLDKKLSPRRVHASRVVLRRWYSVWDILAIDGWEDSGYPDGGYEKNIGADLRRVNKLLGGLRDLDVCVGLARQLKINKIAIKHLARKRRKRRDKVSEKLADLKPVKLAEKLRNYLGHRSEQLHYALQRSRPDSLLVDNERTAYFHLDQFLLQAEHQSRLLSEPTRNDEELHELRLSIKRWRYLLTEFFGLTNLELVRAQQILGKIRDLNRLLGEIEDLKPQMRKAFVKRELTAKTVLHERRMLNKLIDEQFKELEEVIKKLPFGLRPYLLSCQSE